MDRKDGCHHCVERVITSGTAKTSKISQSKVDDQEDLSIVENLIITAIKAVDHCSTSNNHGWVLDMGAHFPSTLQRRVFTTYQRTRFGQVKIENKG